MTEVEAIIGGVVFVVLVGLIIWIVHLARAAQQEKDAAQAAADATATAQEQRSMASAQVSAAPSDDALDASLTEGTF